MTQQSANQRKSYLGTQVGKAFKPSKKKFNRQSGFEKAVTVGRVGVEVSKDVGLGARAVYRGTQVAYQAGRSVAKSISKKRQQRRRELQREAARRKQRHERLKDIGANGVNSKYTIGKGGSVIVKSYNKADSTEVRSHKRSK